MASLGFAGGPRILQVHPTLKCNLRCLHCYSMSGPQQSTRLDPALIERAIQDVADLGYEAVSFSGGEPTLYPHLRRLLETTKDAGLFTAVTTNATTLDNRRLTPLAELVDTWAVSVDGPAPIHDVIRAQQGAFERMRRGLHALREHGAPFGVIHTLTRSSRGHLAWLFGFAMEEMAARIQIHPLEAAGRARQGLDDAFLQQDDLCRAYLETLALSSMSPDTLNVQFDAYHRQFIEDEPAAVGLLETAEAAGPRVLSLTAEGDILPETVSMPTSYGITNLGRAPLADVWPSYLEKGLHAFQALLRTTRQKVLDDADRALVNWPAAVAAEAQSQAARVMT
jgi:Fe-coproporphyrin III synthase